MKSMKGKDGGKGFCHLCKPWKERTYLVSPFLSCSCWVPPQKGSPVQIKTSIILLIRTLYASFIIKVLNSF